MSTRPGSIAQPKEALAASWARGSLAAPFIQVESTWPKLTANLTATAMNTGELCELWRKWRARNHYNLLFIEQWRTIASRTENLCVGGLILPLPTKFWAWIKSRLRKMSEDAAEECLFPTIMVMSGAQSLPTSVPSPRTHFNDRRGKWGGGYSEIVAEVTAC